MNIVLLEPFFTGSHKQWAEGFRQHSRHDVQLLTLPGRHWKWRMHGAALTFARQVREQSLNPDLWLATDFLDVSTFRGLLATDRQPPRPLVTYFHENQLTYPWSDGDPDTQSGRDGHFHFINLATALASDAAWFNSAYHRHSFLDAADTFLRRLPDHREPETIDLVRDRSRVVPLGLDLARFDAVCPAEPRPPGPPIILWNHRWEYDKNPGEFFDTLAQLTSPFRLVVLGESFRESPAVFEQAREKFADQILHWGFAPSFADYARWLWHADLLPVTSNQDFFGGSVVEAMYCGCVPLLPNRLAYPEHVGPDGLYAAGELLPRLEALLQKRAGEGISDFREAVARYDWEHIAPQMDEALAALVVRH